MSSKWFSGDTRHAWLDARDFGTWSVRWTSALSVSLETQAAHALSVARQVQAVFSVEGRSSQLHVAGASGQAVSAHAAVRIA
eukprot:345185-Chlamydomonas_euryale.AAC.1